MGIGSITWIVAGWLVVSVVVSLILGRILRHTTTAMDEDAVNAVVSRRKVVRYLRNGRPVTATANPQVGKARRSAR